jgi:hypothetical protein
MSQEKGESYLDELLKGLEENPVSYDNYAKVSKSDTADDAIPREESLSNDDISLEELLPEGASAIEKDIPLPATDTAIEDEIPLPEAELAMEDEIPLPEPEAAIEKDIPLPEPEAVLEEEIPLPDLEPVFEDVENEEINNIEEGAPVTKEPVLEEEATVEMGEENLDNIVENLLDNLDNTGSLDATQSDDSELDTADDLLKLLEEENSAPIVDDGSTKEEEEETFSLDDMLNGLDDLNSLEVSDEEEAAPIAVADLEDTADLEAMPSDVPDASGDLGLSDALGLSDDLADSLGVSFDDDFPDISPEDTQKEAVEKKPSIFQKIFGNLHDEKAEKQKEAALKAEEKKEEKKKAKKSKEEIAEEKKQKAAEKKEKQDVAKKIKEAKKKEKDERKEKKKAQKAKEQAEEVDEGRINPVGATIVFAFFGIAAVVIIFGSRGFSYTQSIAKATEFFGVQEYNEAYDEVRGVTIKEDDQEIYDKIMTVMYVNKQLNSYNNYYSLRMYPEALDSLLKGLKRYDEYISDATEMGIRNDMDYVKTQILGELNEAYQMSEADAYQLIDAANQEEYSQMVIKKAGEAK